MSDQPLDAASLDGLLDALGGDREALEELVDEFVSDATELVDEAMATAVDDPERFRRAVHSLKSTSATFGALELSSACRRMEQAAIAGQPVSVDDLDGLARACRTAVDALRSRMGAA